jgi:hypothetical protein
MKILTTTALVLTLAMTAALPVGAAEVKVKDFRTLDVDKDGRVSGGEAQSENSLSEMFQQADANRDGFLNEAEYSAWLKTLKSHANGHNPNTP